MSASKAHPVVFSLLMFPFGAVAGFVSVALAFLGPKYGLSSLETASLGAAGSFVHMWKFAWAPIADTTLTRRTWYLLSTACCAAAILATSAVPLSQATLPLLTLVIAVMNVATTVMGMAVEGLLAHLVEDDDRGRFGGWFQAGNLGGYGIGGGAGLYLLETLPAAWMAGALLAVVFLLCAAPLLRLPDVPAERRDGGLLAAVTGAVGEVPAMLRRREGRIAGILCLLPIGTGAAAGVLAQSDVAAQWGAGAGEVAVVSGWLNGGLSAVGCVIGGDLCGRYRARNVYASVGALLAFTAIGMAAAPMTPLTFVLGNLSYAFVTGLAFAAYTGFVLEAIGQGAAATKYNAFSALANTPIWYMGLALGAMMDARGTTAMLWLEAGAAFVGLGVLGFVVWGLPSDREPSSATMG